MAANAPSSLGGVRRNKQTDFSDEALRAVGRFALVFGQLESLVKKGPALNQLTGMPDTVANIVLPDRDGYWAAVDRFAQLLQARLRDEVKAGFSEQVLVDAKDWAERAKELGKFRNQLLHNWALPEVGVGSDAGGTGLYSAKLKGLSVEDVLERAAEAEALFHMGAMLANAAITGAGRPG